MDLVISDLCLSPSCDRNLDARGLTTRHHRSRADRQRSGSMSALHAFQASYGCRRDFTALPMPLGAVPLAASARPRLVCSFAKWGPGGPSPSRDGKTRQLAP